MPISKIKNLILLILSLSVLFLLILVVPQRAESARAEQALHEQLQTLFASYDISLDGDALPDSASLYALELATEETGMQTAATALLGQDAALEDGTTRFAPVYSAASGTCSMQFDGSFHAALSGREAVSDTRKDAQSLLTKMGFTCHSLSQPQRESAGVYRIDAEQALLGVPVFSEGLHLTYVNGALREIGGVFFTGEQKITRVSEESCISCADALAALLSCRDRLGWVGSSILSVKQGYRYTESATTSVRLLPVWLIETDTETFQVNGLTGEVQQQE